LGENSKRSGEIGEALASALLDRIGWKNLMQNVSINCNTPAHLNDAGNPRTTHGEDQIFLYSNPFHDDRTDIVHISNKNVLGTYAKGNTLKSQFKAHLKELHQTIDCAKYSPELNQICTTFGAKKHKFHSGLLVWLHNDDEDIEHNIKPELSNTRLEIDSNDPVYVVDNARATFLLRVVDDLKVRAAEGNYEFFYPRIGTAVSVDESRTGKVLPLELIAADIIPALVKKGIVHELVLYANQPFEEISYQKLIAYGLNFGSGLVSSIHIGMTNYNAALDQNTATRLRMAFHDRPETVTPFSFNRSILDLLQVPTT